MFILPPRSKTRTILVLHLCEKEIVLKIVSFISFFPILDSNTFSSVQANANQIWKFQRYYLVMEYSQRPVLVPPFIIFNHVIHALRGLYHWLKNCLGRGKRNQEESSYGLSMASLCEWNNILINKTEKSLSTPVTIRSSACSDFSQLSYRDMLGRVFHNVLYTEGLEKVEKYPVRRMRKLFLILLFWSTNRPSFLFWFCFNKYFPML